MLSRDAGTVVHCLVRAADDDAAMGEEGGGMYAALSHQLGWPQESIGLVCRTTSLVRGSMTGDLIGVFAFPCAADGYKGH
jgi:hypothetical protein